MTRATAAISGLAMAAASIGFNVAHYPIVWRMTAPPESTSAASSLAPARSPETGKKSPSVVRSAARSSLPTSDDAAVAEKPAANVPAGPMRPRLSDEPVMPESSALSKPAEHPLARNENDGHGAPTQGADERFSLASLGTNPPLTPVPRVIPFERILGDETLGNEVRRLPPVDPNVSPPAWNDPGADGAPVPVYPCTAF